MTQRADDGDPRDADTDLSPSELPAQTNGSGIPPEGQATPSTGRFENGRDPGQYLDRDLRYEILRPPVSGTQGGVYLTAVRAGPGNVRYRAVKVFSAGDSADRAARRDREIAIARYFQEQARDGQYSEAQFLGLSTDDFSTFDGDPAMATPWIDGRSLRAVLDRHCLDREGAARACEQIGHGIHVLWRDHGILHRDVKPANLLAHARGMVVFVDFGVAAWRDHDSGLTDLVGREPGTKHYMSPHRLANSAARYQDEIFSLAVVAYELITGEKPRRKPEDPVVPLTERAAYIAAASSQLPDLTEAQARAWLDRLWRVLEPGFEKYDSYRPGGDKNAETFAESLASALRAGPEGLRFPLLTQAPNAVARNLIEVGETTYTRPRSGIPTVEHHESAGPRSTPARRPPTPTEVSKSPGPRNRTPTARPGPRRPKGRNTSGRPKPPFPVARVVVALLLATSGLALAGVIGLAAGWRPFGTGGSETSLRMFNPNLGGNAPTLVAVTGHDLWIVDSGGIIRRLSAATGRPVDDPVTDSLGPAAITSGGGSIWVLNTSTPQDARFYAKHCPGFVPLGTTPNSGCDAIDGSVTRINEASGTVQGKPIPVGPQRGYDVDSSGGIAYAGQSVWVTNKASVTRISAVSGQVVGNPIQAGYQPSEIVGSGDTVWVEAETEPGNAVDSSHSYLTALDAQTGGVERTYLRDSEVGNFLDDFEFNFVAVNGSIWVSNLGEIQRFSVATGQPESNARGLSPLNAQLAVGGDSVWVVGDRFNGGPTYAAAFDPQTGIEHGEAVRLPASPADLAADGNQLWAVYGLNSNGALPRPSMTVLTTTGSAGIQPRPTTAHQLPVTTTRLTTPILTPEQRRLQVLRADAQRQSKKLVQSLRREHQAMDAFWNQYAAAGYTENSGWIALRKVVEHQFAVYGVRARDMGIAPRDARRRRDVEVFITEATAQRQAWESAVRQRAYVVWCDPGIMSRPAPAECPGA